MKLELVLPYPPSANRYWRTSRRGYTYVSPEARQYKEWVRRVALEAGVRLLEGPVLVYIDVYRPRRAGDLSNRIKVLEDALEGVAYRDDDQVVELHARRFDDPRDPRVEVSILPRGHPSS